MTFAEGLRVAATLAWFVSPPILVALAVVIWARARRSGTKICSRAIPIGPLAAANWSTFAIVVFKSQTPYGAVFQTSLLTHTLLILSILSAVASLLPSKAKGPLLLANLSMITLWVGVVYAQSHWLRKWDYGKVAINGHPTQASVFIANPWDSEAEAVVLVHIPPASDYFLSFGEEKVRVAAKGDYVRLPGGVWSFPSLRELQWTDPLPPQQLNEFRIRSANGDVISVQF